MKARLVAAALMALLMLVGCSPAPSGGPATLPPGGSNAPGATAGATAAATPGATAGGNVPSQTDTEWGRIWDGVPASFPEPPDARPATDTGEGPSSAQLSVPGGRDAIVQFYLDALAGAGYAVNRDGPLEDGSVTVSASKGAGCQVQASVQPVDAGVIITLLYGAGCPFE